MQVNFLTLQVSSLFAGLPGSKIDLLMSRGPILLFENLVKGVCHGGIPSRGFAGIGLEIELNDNKWIITDVNDGSVAHSRGILPGDVIVAVRGLFHHDNFVCVIGIDLQEVRKFEF